MKLLKKPLTKESPKPPNPNAISEALDMIQAKVDGMSKQAKELLDLAGHIR